MASVTQSVKFLLSGAGYRTGDAAPGKVMPEIAGPVMAVNLEGLDTKKRVATVRVTVVSPVWLGARSCEDEALKVCKLLRNAGAVCEIEAYKLDAEAEVFMLPVMAAFQGDVLSNSWQIGESCVVQFDTEVLEKVLTFTAWRQVIEDNDAIANMHWHFRIEEQLDGICRETQPTEPFTVTVSRGDSQEVYSGCRLTLHKRTLADGGLVQIREGTAASRTVTE